jgi:hypothetical protein
VPIAKKTVGHSPDNKVLGVHSELTQPGRSPSMLPMAWPWPRAVVAIVLLSLLIWGIVAGIALLAFH